MAKFHGFSVLRALSPVSGVVVRFWLCVAWWASYCELEGIAFYCSSAIGFVAFLSAVVLYLPRSAGARAL